MQISRKETDTLSLKTQNLINLILDAQVQLGRQDIVAYFRQNSEAQTHLIKDAQAELKSYPLIIRGLKEKYGSLIIPSMGDLDHEEGWLESGDVFIGVIGHCHSYPSDRPYVVSGQSDNGYTWRYIDEPEDTSRPPMRNDPHLRLCGWWKVSIVEDPFEDINGFIQTEIDALSKYVNLLRNFPSS